MVSPAFHVSVVVTSLLVAVSLNGEFALLVIEAGMIRTSS
jgi:hypothetical protein